LFLLGRVEAHDVDRGEDLDRVLGMITRVAGHEDIDLVVQRALSASSRPCVSVVMNTIVRALLMAASIRSAGWAPRGGWVALVN
jgi:hypothetical protein